MASASEILGALSVERLREVVEAAPRKAREELFRKAGIRAKGSAFSLRSQDKAERMARLKAKLEQGAVEVDAAEEVLRSYLGQRPELLGDALDHFEVPHQQGMTDADLDFMEKLAPNRVQAFWRFLQGRGHADADIELYARYMQMPERP